MPRIGHGEVATPQQLHAAEQDLASQAASIELGFAVAAPAGLQDFDFLFLELQDDDANLLPKWATTVKRRSPAPGPGGYVSYQREPEDPAERQPPATMTIPMTCIDAPCSPGQGSTS